MARLRWFAVFVAAVCGILAVASPAGASDVFSYDVTFKHGGVDKVVHVSAWRPENVPLRGMLYLTPSWGGDTRSDVSDEQYRGFAEAIGFGIIGMEDRDGRPREGQYQGADANEVRANVQAVLDAAAAGLACPQISNAPLAFYGFSKGGWVDTTLAAHLPDRTICFIADKSASWLSSISDAAAFVPGMPIMGSTDNGVGTAAPLDIFSTWRSPRNGQVALIVDWNVSHSPADFGMVEAFISQSIARRCPAGQLPSATVGNPLKLYQIDPNSGWLVETSCDSKGPAWIRCPDAAAYKDYGKTASAASWLPTKTMAMAII